jgi:hypothetical protein
MRDIQAFSIFQFLHISVAKSFIENFWSLWGKFSTALYRRRNRCPLIMYSSAIHTRIPL